MPKIKLNPDKLVGYTRTDSTKSGVAKLGTAKLGCKSVTPPNYEEDRRQA